MLVQIAQDNLVIVNLTANHIEYRKQIGTLQGKPVFEIGTTGGLHLVVVAKAAGIETIGAGSHSAIARHIAKKKAPEMILTSLAKSEHVDPSCFAHLLPQWEAETDRFRSIK